MNNNYYGLFILCIYLLFTNIYNLYKLIDIVFTAYVKEAYIGACTHCMSNVVEVML